MGFGPTPPGTGSHPGCEAVWFARSDVAGEARRSPVDADVDDGRSGLHVLGADQVQHAHCTTRISTCRVTAARSVVWLWVIVTVASRCGSRWAIGRPHQVGPAYHETAREPWIGTPSTSRSSTTPLKIQGRKPARCGAGGPALAVVRPYDILTHRDTVDQCRGVQAGG